MLRISKLTDYATVLLAHLAEDGAGQRTAVELAEWSKIGLPTVSKVLKELQRAGLVVSTRGARGGYSLARSADTISAADILDAVEGPIGLTECSIHPGQCELESNCRVGRTWQRVNLAIHQALADLRLTDLANAEAGAIPELIIRIGPRLTIRSRTESA
ncbi:MAG: SUF system Fe-S cluster assembly regulator [Pseudomonadota bacterium]